MPARSRRFTVHFLGSQLLSLNANRGIIYLLYVSIFINVRVDVPVCVKS